jgi:hypothetical protein
MTENAWQKVHAFFLPLKLSKTIMKTEPIWGEKENEYG